MGISLKVKSKWCSKHSSTSVDSFLSFSFFSFFFSAHSEGRMKEVVCLSTLRGEYKLGAVFAHRMVELLSTFLNGLKERSIYALAVQDCSRQGAGRTHTRTHTCISASVSTTR